MTTSHTKQPSLCADCEEIARALAESGPMNDPVIKRCRHNATVAIASKRNGIIVHWYVQGPLSDNQAHQVAAAFLSATDLSVHEVRHQ